MKTKRRILAASLVLLSSVGFIIICLHQSGLLERLLDDSAEHARQFHQAVRTNHQHFGKSAGQKPVSYKMESGSRLAPVVEELGKQAGVRLRLADPSLTSRWGLSYSGEFAPALANLCLNYNLTVRKSSVGSFELAN